MNTNNYLLSDKLELICPAHIRYSQVSNAFVEDSLVFADWTSSLIPESEFGTASIVAKENCVLCGASWVNIAFSICGISHDDIKWNYADGDSINTGSIVCEIVGKARSLLKAERVALNFLQTLSGVATKTYSYVELVKHLKVKVMDTRKTIPGIRLAQKYAVVAGGGHNQRNGLYDGVLIKENHIASGHGISGVLAKAQSHIPSYIPIQIEVEEFSQLVESAESGAKLILLDNMSLPQIIECVSYIKQNYPDVELEVSGGINHNNILEYASTGVSRISIGDLTKNITSIDLSMRLI